MKKFIFLLSFFFVSIVFAQQNMHWRAVYQYKKITTEKQKARRDSIAKVHPEMADMMKKLYKRLGNKTFFLDFNQNESVYKVKPHLSKPGKRNFSISFLDNGILYKDLRNKTYIQKTPFFDETYLVIDSLPDYHWKITGETKKIGNYTVIKAEGTEIVKKRSKKEKDQKEIKWENKVEKVTAWFTPEIPISNGPSKYNGLPGLIMELDKNKEVILLKELIVNPTTFNEIKKPEKGKKVNEKEFETIKMEKMKKMEKMYKSRRNNRNSSNRMIIVR